jgi:hypothetical protein
MGAIGLIPFVFPLIGLVFIILGIRKGIKGNRLLAYGRLGTGRLKSKVGTSAKVNGQPVYKLTFEFVTPEGATYEAVAKTHQPEKLEDEATEPLLYDPVLPSYAAMLDDLPGSPRIDETGSIRAGSALSALLSLVVPAAGIVGHTGYICLKLLS